MIERPSENSPCSREGGELSGECRDGDDRGSQEEIECGQGGRAAGPGEGPKGESESGHPAGEFSFIAAAGHVKTAQLHGISGVVITGKAGESDPDIGVSTSADAPDLGAEPLQGRCGVDRQSGSPHARALRGFPKATESDYGRVQILDRPDA